MKKVLAFFHLLRYFCAVNQHQHNMKIIKSTTPYTAMIEGIAQIATLATFENGTEKVIPITSISVISGSRYYMI